MLFYNTDVFDLAITVLFITDPSFHAMSQSLNHRCFVVAAGGVFVNDTAVIVIISVVYSD